MAQQAALKTRSAALRLTCGNGGGRWRGRWAGCEFETDFPAPGLAPVHRSSAPGRREPGNAPWPPAGGIVRARGHLAGRVHVFDVAWEKGRGELHAPGLGRCRIDLASGSAAVLTSAADPAVRRLLLTGPCTALLLAARGRFVLHASAVRGSDGRVVLLLGPSGVGKSTLAASARAGGGALLADDLAALSIEGGRVLLPGLLPQPRWRALPPIDGPLELARVLLLDPHDGRPRLTPMAAPEAALSLVAHSVAARLFPKDLLTAHLAFCADVAERARAARLSYRKDPANLPAMVALLQER